MDVKSPNAEELFTKDYWRKIRQRAQEHIPKDVVESVLLPLFYFSIDDFRFKVHQHVMGCFRRKNRRHTKYGNERLARVYNPPFLLKPKVRTGIPLVPITQTLPCLYNRKSPAKVVAFWAKIIDDLIKRLTLDELKEVYEETLVSPAPFYILHFYAWKHMNFITGKHPFPVKKYPFDQDTSRIRETWGAEEVSFDKVSLMTQVVMSYSDGKNQCVVSDCQVVFSDGAFPGQARSMLVIRYKNMVRTYFLNNLPPDLRIFLKPELNRETETFTCKWENNHFCFNLDREMRDIHRCFPWDVEPMDLVLMSYRDPNHHFNNRNVSIFRLLHKDSPENWRVRKPDHKEANINIYEYAHPTFYKVDTKSIDDEKNQFVKLTCVAIPRANETNEFTHRFDIEMDAPMEMLLMPKLIECAQLGWLGRDLISDHGKVNIFSFMIPIEGRDELIRSMSMKISSLLPGGYCVRRQNEGHSVTKLIISGL
jgi:hypothetical protein